MNAPPPCADRTAGVVTRSLAALVDLVVVLALAGLCLLGAAGVRFAVSPESFRWPSPPWLVSLVVGAALATGYLAVGWAVSGRSVGGAVVGVRVGSRRGGPLGWGRSALRALLCVLVPVGLLWCVVSRHRRSVQDALLGTVVLYDGGDVLPATRGGRWRIHPARVGWTAPQPGHGVPTSAAEEAPP